MLIIEGNLPIGWHPITGNDVAPLARQYDSHNVSLLRVLQLVEISGSEHADDAIANSEMHRIEAKLDIVIELLAELLGREQAAPASRAIRFSIEHLVLEHDPNPPAIGEHVAVELILSPRVPRPLRFVALTEQVVPRPDGAEVTFRLVELGPQAREELERQIFLLHRRSLQRNSLGTGATRI